MANETPSVWVADLAAYNEGSLVGRWIPVADLDYEEISEWLVKQTCDFCKKYGMTHEEWLVHDYEYMPNKLGETSDIETLQAIAEAVEQYDYETVNAYLANADDVDSIEDSIYGYADSEADFAQQWYEDTGTDTGSLGQYIDWDAVAEGEFFNGDFWSAPAKGGIVVFRSV